MCFISTQLKSGRGRVVIRSQKKSVAIAGRKTMERTGEREAKGC
jgi:hypothetical protein